MDIFRPWPREIVPKLRTVIFPSPCPRVPSMLPSQCPRKQSPLLSSVQLQWPTFLNTPRFRVVGLVSSPCRLPLSIAARIGVGCSNPDSHPFPRPLPCFPFPSLPLHPGLARRCHTRLCSSLVHAGSDSVVYVTLSLCVLCMCVCGHRRFCGAKEFRSSNSPSPSPPTSETHRLSQRR